ncbi:hypothetical protein B0H13DRAFT_2667698 [Mycena leptocephala]|nr:hypothetical protein B0H13DRAFT_2667698 [Mycena leptocephala]
MTVVVQASCARYELKRTRPRQRVYFPTPRCVLSATERPPSLTLPPSAGPSCSSISPNLSNELGKIVTSASPYEISAALEKNSHDYATAILLSSKISAYKGSVPTNMLLDILKKRRFDLPVISAVQDAFTQLRSKFKKTLLASLKVYRKATDLVPGPQQQNIFKLTQVLVKGTQCSVSVALVALMHRTYLIDAATAAV